MSPESRPGKIVQAKVIRVNPEGLGIVRISEDQQTAFTFDQIQGYKGQYPREMGLVKGAEVSVVLSPEGNTQSVSFPFEDKRPKLFGRWVLPWAVNS